MSRLLCLLCLLLLHLARGQQEATPAQPRAWLEDTGVERTLDLSEYDY